MKRKILFLFLVTLFSGLLSAGGRNLSVPLGSDAYRIIDSAVTRGIIPMQSSVKPYSLEKTVTLLERIEESSLISSDEKQTVRRLLTLLDDSYTVREDAPLLEKGYRGWQIDLSSAVAAGMKFSSRQTVSSENGVFDSRNRVTAYVKGNLFSSFSFYMDFGVLLDRLDHRAFLITDFRHDCDGFYMSLFSGADFTSSPFSSFGDGFVMNPELAAVLFDGALTMRFASVSRDWGPGENNIALSKSARSFDAVEFTLEPASFFTLSSLVGSLGKSYLILKDETPLTGDSDLHSNLYDNAFSLQRIEVEFFEGFRASIYESVVWRKRFELAYLNPLGVYMFAQNYIGDFDNMLAGLDLQYVWKGVGRFYLTLGIDEFNKAALFWARNIFSCQGGAVFPVPVLSFSTLTLQATYVGPFFGSHYTYKSGMNPWGSTAMATGYVNKGYALSYPLYPDSVEILASFRTSLEEYGLSLDFTVKDQMRSAQYSTESTGGTTLETLINYYYTAHVDAYAKRDFFSYIWRNDLLLSLSAEKKFEKSPVSLSAALGCIITQKRSYTLDPATVKEYECYDIVDTEGGKMITNPGTGTVMGTDWSTSTRFTLSVGFTLYY